MSWTSPLTATAAAPSGGTNSVYNFTYDGLNRLLGATGTANEEKGLSYDLNGNIKTLQRTKNSATIDNLTYNYTDGNRLNKIDDSSGSTDGFKDIAGTDYDYDANGNLTQDLNKGIGAGKLNYNLLNLVRKIEIGNNVLDYYYDAAGTKHQMGYSNPNDPTKNETTRYVGSMEWLGIHLKRIATGEGQVIFKTASVGQYQYYVTDHLGNTRVVVNDSGRVLQRTDYYAFGLAIDVVDRTVNKYLYNGKELQPETGLLDYGARQYMPEIGRWGGLDVKSEKYHSWTPYNYVANNPINAIDPDGKDLVKIRVPDGEGGVKFAIVDTKIAKAAYDFAWYIYEKFGAVVTESYRTDEDQRNVNPSGGMKAKVGNSRHQQGFALDFGFKSAFHKKKITYDEMMKEIEKIGITLDMLSIWKWRYEMKDYPHFELDALDYGYETRLEAYNVNKKFYEEHGGRSGIPSVAFDKEEKTVIINGKKYQVGMVTKEEANDIINYINSRQKNK